MLNGRFELKIANHIWLVYHVILDFRPAENTEKCYILPEMYVNHNKNYTSAVIYLLQSSN